MIRTYARKKHKDENAAGANNKGEADPANPKAKKKTYGGRRNHRKVPELSPPKSKDGGRSASPEGGPFSISGPKEAEGAPASKSPSASPSFVLFRDRVDSTFDRLLSQPPRSTLGSKGSAPTVSTDFSCDDVIESSSSSKNNSSSSSSKKPGLFKSALSDSKWVTANNQTPSNSNPIERADNSDKDQTQGRHVVTDQSHLQLHNRFNFLTATTSTPCVPRAPSQHRVFAGVDGGKPNDLPSPVVAAVRPAAWPSPSLFVASPPRDGQLRCRPDASVAGSVDLFASDAAGLEEASAGSDRADGLEGLQVEVALSDDSHHGRDLQEKPGVPDVVQERAPSPPDALQPPPPPPHSLAACTVYHYGKGGKNWRRRSTRQFGVAESEASTARRPSEPPSFLGAAMEEKHQTQVCPLRRSSFRLSSATTRLHSKKMVTTIFLEESDEDGELFSSEANPAPDEEPDEKENGPKRDFQSQNGGESELSILDVPTPLSVIEKVLSRCRENRVVPFGLAFDEDALQGAKKIGEGAFGEVFQLEGKCGGPSVLKVVPVNGEALVNGQPQTKLSDMLAEVVISTELSRLGQDTGDCRDGSEAANSRLRSGTVGFVAPSFVQVHGCQLVEGDYPEKLLQLWDEYDAERGSENDRPDPNLFEKGQLPESAPQKFMALEFGFGGQDLEHVVLNNASQGLSVFHQVALALAVAESRCRFEHRDLHWGNILVKFVVDKQLTFRLDQEEIQVETNGVVATIIDFSLSRITVTLEATTTAGHSRGMEQQDIYNNLNEDEELFTAEGDYQFEVYRQMRKHTKGDWEKFSPKTNILWLVYLLDKLCSEVQYKSKRSKCHRNSASILKSLRPALESSCSAHELVTSKSFKSILTSSPS